MATNKLDGLDLRTFKDAAQWEAWLSEHHGRDAGVWLRIAKKASGRTSVTIAEALDVALCYGWIDGQRRALDESYFLQKYTPRRPRSSWSKVNTEKVEALIAAGRMRAPGLAEVEAARENGRWDAAYVSQKEATVPPDLADALERDAEAAAAFEALGRTDRYLVILSLLKTLKPERRAARLREIVTVLKAG